MAELPKPKNVVVELIYGVHEEQQRQQRPHPFGSSIGPSMLGNECDRALWYAFRWAYDPEPPNGRSLRLFETGHREEARIIAELRAAGVEVTGEQAEVAALGGHLHGYLDGVVLGISGVSKAHHVLEIKTHNEKSYADLWKKGVQKSKPGHYAQMQLYMHLGPYERALYIAVNKNDDQLYSERVRYNKQHAEALLHRVEYIVTANAAPTKLHEDPAAREAFVCGWCPARGICHEDAFAPRNCRTCLHISPIIDGESGADGGDRGGRRGVWRCEFWDRTLTLDEQRAGCPEHRYLPSLVPGEQTDAFDRGGQIDVTYRMRRDGREWTDGV
jgi:PD-(D/E)XK nuclease superfamily